MKFGFIAKRRGVWPVSWICEAPKVLWRCFAQRLLCLTGPRARSDEMLGARVRANFIASYCTYGARRVWHNVLAEGQPCGLHRIERLCASRRLRRGRAGAVCRGTMASDR